MDGARMAAKVYAGFGKAASRVGLPYDQYRASSASNPLAIGNKVGTLPAAFTIHATAGFNFNKPSDYKDPQFHALIDPTTLQVGDYLVAQTGIFGPFFVAGLTSAMPPLVVQTNRTVSVFNPGPQNVAVGASGYGGTTLANETAIMSGWPVSALLASRGVRDQQLPEDAGYGSWRILMPAYPGVVIRPGSIITDDLNNRMIVQSAEMQDFGWRLDATQAVT